jgi:hypothetical protein
MVEKATPTPPNGPFWLVIRVYRGRRRVISMHSALSEAETSFFKSKEQLRDGSVVLAKTEIEVLAAENGGYNRTRW